MNTTQSIVIDITMPELHKHIKQWQIRNPSVEDALEAMLCAIHERWPSADLHQVLEQAEANWIVQDRLNMARDKTRDSEKWIDTRVQGDMFNDLPISVPEYIIKDGKAVEYWKCTLPQMLEHIDARIKTMQFEEQQLRAAADVKRSEIDAFAGNAAKIRAAIERAEESGIDPMTLKYAKAG